MATFQPLVTAEAACYIILYSLVLTYLKGSLHCYRPSLLHSAHNAWEICSTHLWTGLIKHFHKGKVRHEISLSLHHSKKSEPSQSICAPSLAKASVCCPNKPLPDLGVASILHLITQVDGLYETLSSRTARFIHCSSYYHSILPHSLFKVKWFMHQLVQLYLAD